MSLRVDCEHDSDHGAPWEEDDGHGPVSEWTTRDKRPGERLLHSDRHSKRYYDFAAAIKQAKRDGWDAPGWGAPPYKTGTKGETALRAVKRDFQYLKDWCEDRWEYVVVIVKLLNADGEEIASDALGGVESEGDYWRECAAEMANTMLADYIAEDAERSYWEARDVETLPA